MVCHSHGEYARDEDGDGFCEVHVNTMEGFWSLLRSWLRPHRGISQEFLPDYLGFFEFVHNVKYRDKRFLVSLLTLALSHRTTWNSIRASEFLDTLELRGCKKIPEPTEAALRIASIDATKYPRFVQGWRHVVRYVPEFHAPMDI